MIILGVEELRRIADLGGDRAATGRREPRLVSAPRSLRNVTLLLVQHVNGRAVLRADIIPLTHALSWVMRFPERLEQVLVTDLLGIVDDAHDFGMPGLTGANLLVGRIRREAARVADGARVNTGKLPEKPLRAPEAPKAKHGLAHARRERRHNAMSVDEVGLRDLKGRSAPGQRGSRRRHARFLTEQRHENL